MNEVRYRRTWELRALVVKVGKMDTVFCNSITLGLKTIEVG